MRLHPIPRVIAAVLVILGLLALPTGIISHWGKTQLLDTPTFSAALAPLAQDPGIQQQVTDEATGAIMDRVESVVHDSRIPADRLPQWLSTLTQQTGTALGNALDTALDEKVQPLVHEAVQSAVRSDAFARTWEQGVHLSHTQSLAVLREESSTVNLQDSGRLSINLGVLVDAVKTDLEQRGVSLASLIPDVDHEVVLLHYSDLGQAKGWVAFFDATGGWLLWASLGLLAAGLLLNYRALPLTAATASLLLAAVVALSDFVQSSLGRWLGQDGQGGGIVRQGYTNLVQQEHSLLVALAIWVGVLAVASRLVITPGPGAARDAGARADVRARLREGVGYGTILLIALWLCLGFAVSPPALAAVVVLAVVGLLSLRPALRALGR